MNGTLVFRNAIGPRLAHRFSVELRGRLITAGKLGRCRTGLRCLVFLALATSTVVPPGATLFLRAQAPGAAPSPIAVAPTEAIRPALNRIHEVLAGLNVSRWKAPGEVRSVTQRDIDSIQHDIASTLPPLLDQAAGPAASVASYFAVYRNIDALYDVLLRVSETATLAGSQSDADTLQGTLASLESSRRNLGDAILAAAANQEQELAGLRAAVARAAAEAAKPIAPTKTIVDDGPAPPSKAASAAKKKKKAAPAAKPPAASPPASPQ